MDFFLKRFLQFLIPLIILSVIFEFFLRRIPNDYSYKNEYLNRNSNEINILFLGNSHFYYGINPEFIKGKAFNAAHISQSLDYDLEIIKKYSQKLGKLKYLVLTVDYFSLYSTLDNGVEDWRAKNYRIYYNIYRGNLLHNNFEIFTTLPKDNIDRFINFYFRDSSSVYCSTLGWGMGYKSINNEDLVITANVAAERHKAKTNEYFNHNTDVIEKIIDWTKHKNIKVIFVTTPAYSTYVSALDSLQLNNTVRQMKDIVDNNHSYYLNLLKDTSFNKQDFFDADHVNEKGANKLTTIIDSFINKNI